MRRNAMDKPVTILTENLGKRLAAYRLSLNLRQQDVANSIGIARSTVARLETGHGGTIDTLVRVLKALGVEDRIEMIVPDARVRPLDQRPDAELRQRARPDIKQYVTPGRWSWADET
jgi:transcriptional regulator with XRE-family HTH domain